MKTKKLFITGTEINVQAISLTTDQERKILDNQDASFDGVIFTRNAPELPKSYTRGSFVFRYLSERLTVNSL